ncbi:hypothetical protein TRFO_26372 [Tritrichomonas foetus]|uniref:Uncharacterized protein n=1 Tax=Tritrichomonas foetus TaxID=1144522 RepID=A0A1J4K8M4_9EUKA|nr:hypothetical protein TRFO_26372 [Tritrichomonas foetus]|eukprot:OHT05781.1 hypothetical protein TRFO_26372 [Tritrichomonas foetus]
MFFLLFFTAEARNLTKLKIPPDNLFISTFLLNRMDVFRLQKDGITSTSKFPLTVNTTQYYTRLKDYSLSFYSVPFKFFLITISVFLIVLFFSLILWTFWIKPKKKNGSFWRATIVVLLKLLQIAFELILACISVVILIKATQLKNDFPVFQEYTSSICDSIDQLIYEMCYGIVELAFKNQELIQGFSPFDEFNVYSKNIYEKIGYQTNNSIFTQIRQSMTNFETLSKELNKTVKKAGFQELYKKYLDPILPNTMKCTNDCFNLLNNYSRSDLINQQILKITNCKGRDGVLYDNCLDIFENISESFLSYFEIPHKLHANLISELSDWDDIYMPKLDSFIEFSLNAFSYQLRNSTTEFLDKEFTFRSKAIDIGIGISICGIFLCILFMIAWIFHRRIWISIFSSLNVLFIAAITFLVGSYIGHALFLQQAMFNMDKLFDDNHVDDQYNVFFRLFECQTGYVGSSTNFGILTSGHEFIINNLIYEILDTVIPNIAKQVEAILNPLVYFAVFDYDTQATLYPYYEIGEKLFENLTSSSINNNHLFSIFTKLYNSDLDIIEDRIINLHIQTDKLFADAYREIFSQGKACYGYSLTEISTCATENMSIKSYNYLISQPVTNGLKNLETVQQILKEFTIYGEIYSIEKQMNDLVTKIVKQDLYQISNYLASVYADLSESLESYQDFLFSDNSLYLAYIDTQLIVNGSCLDVNHRYNEFRELLLVKIPYNAYNLSIWLICLIFIPVIISFLNVLYKMLVGGSIKEKNSDSEYSLTSYSSELKDKKSDSSSQFNSSSSKQKTFYNLADDTSDESTFVNYFPKSSDILKSYENHQNSSPETDSTRSKASSTVTNSLELKESGTSMEKNLGNGISLFKAAGLAYFDQSKDDMSESTVQTGISPLAENQNSQLDEKTMETNENLSE